MNCKICSSQTKNIFDATILKKHNVNYFYCDTCGFLQTEEPYWLEEAYQDAINIYDTGILRRSVNLSKLVAIVIYFLFDKKAKFLDYAGGYGILTRLMRDIGLDFYWNDPYSQNLTARGFAYKDDEKGVELITTFESFEHFSDPLIDIERMLKISNNIMFSTNLLPDPVPKPDEWWYYATGHGQHISFYSSKTLKYIGNKYNLNVHLLTDKKINKYCYDLLLLTVYAGLQNLLKINLKSKTISDFSFVKSENG